MIMSPNTIRAGRQLTLSVHIRDASAPVGVTASIISEGDLSPLAVVASTTVSAPQNVVTEITIEVKLVFFVTCRHLFYSLFTSLVYSFIYRTVPMRS